MTDDRFRSDAAVRRVVPLAGKRADRVIVDDIRESCPHCGGDCASANPPVIACPMRSGAALFEDHGPNASVGRRSFPRSHRGEGRNFVD